MLIELSRWLVILVAVITAFGGIIVDAIVPASARQHMRNPAWPPHAKFHNGQGILMGLGSGIITVVLLFPGRPFDFNTLLLAATVTSLYWLSLLFVPLFPGTDWVDPEFRTGTPRPLGMYPQQFIAYILLAMLTASLVLNRFA